MTATHETSLFPETFSLQAKRVLQYPYSLSQALTGIGFSILVVVLAIPLPAIDMEDTLRSLGEYWNPIFIH